MASPENSNLNDRLKISLMHHHQLYMSQTKSLNQVYVFFSFSEEFAPLEGFSYRFILFTFLNGWDLLHY